MGAVSPAWFSWHETLKHCDIGDGTVTMVPAARGDPTDARFGVVRSAIPVRRSVMRRLAIIGSVVLLLVVAPAGFFTALFLNHSVFGNYDAYGEVPIPGTATLHLPQGQVTVSFHTQVNNPQGGVTVGGNDLPIPDLGLTITPPVGVAEPTVTEHSSATTTDGNDAHQQVWVADIAQAGDYAVSTDGKMSGFISPRLAFGHASPYGYLPWVFVGVFVAALLILIGAIRLRSRAGPPAPQLPLPFRTPPRPDPPDR
jgi:hypothetical protein